MSFRCNKLNFTVKPEAFEPILMAQSNHRTEPNPVGLFVIIIQPSLVLPILFDVEAPFPLKMYVFVVIGEQAVDGVRTSGNHS